MMVVLAGLAAGFVHVLSGPDHLAAIVPYAVQAKRRAWRTGVRWGLGHAAGVVAVGLMILALRDAFPIEAVSAWGERLVGCVLIGIGLWGVRGALAGTRRLHAHPSRSHGHKAFAVGTLHGTAGSAHLLGVLPALALPTDFAAATYLLLFGTASVAAMGAFAMLVGRCAGHPVVGSPRAQGALMMVSSLTAMAVGGYWLCGVA